MSMVENAATAGSTFLSSSHYLHWGVVQISLTNFLIIVAMVVVFVLALLLPFPGGATKQDDEEASDDNG